MSDPKATTNKVTGDPEKATATRLTRLREGRLVTQDQLIRSLGQMRELYSPMRFANFLGRYENLLFPLLSAYGWRISPSTTQGYINAFDAVYQNWISVKFSLSSVETDEVILAALPNGTGFIGRRSQYQAAFEYLQFQRFTQTGHNIAGGPVGAIGYLLGGDAGSDIGAFIDGVISVAGHTLDARTQFKALSKPSVYRPDAALIAEQRGAQSLKGGEGTGPAGPRKYAGTPSFPAVTTPAVPMGSDGPVSVGSPAITALVSATDTTPNVPVVPATSGTRPLDKSARYIQSFGGRLQDPGGALPETFRRAGAENRLHARAATPELATIERYLQPGFKGLGGREVAQLIAVRPLSGGRSPDFLVVYADGFVHRLEISTITSVASRGPTLKARGVELVEPTVRRAPLQESFENRLYDKGVVVPGKKPLQLSIAHPAAGPGGVLMLYSHLPTPGTDTMARNAMARMGPRLSPHIWRVEFGLWSRTSKSDKLSRTYLVFERQPDGTYRELPNHPF